jgi:hypothetical protein
MAQTILKYYRIDRREIAFFKYIIEAYDGIAVVSTLDPIAGIVKLSIAPGCEADLEWILQDLKQDVMIEPIAGPTPESLPHVSVAGLPPGTPGSASPTKVAKNLTR